MLRDIHGCDQARLQRRSLFDTILFSKLSGLCDLCDYEIRFFMFHRSSALQFTAMDNYRGLCMGVLWKVCLPQASFCRRYVVSRYPNLGSGGNYSEQRMSGMSQYSVRSNTGLLVWILAFYIFSLSVLNGDQFIFQHSSSTVNGFTP